MTEISCILWKTTMPTDLNERSILAIKALMNAHKLTGVKIGSDMGKGEDGTWIKNVLAGRSQKGLRELSDYLRQAYKMPDAWPELSEVQALPVGQVEHIGRIGAGPGQHTDAEFDPVEVPSSWITPDTRGMTVSGNSMYPFLWDGDQIICKLAERPIPGKIMAVRTSDGLVIKKIVKGEHGFEMVSLAPGYDPIPAHDGKVLGVLIGRYRVYPKPKNRVDLSFDADGLVPED